ncbi:hypothetical protein ACQPYK_41795 [Streptosporangium sp. CA-135522]|uniref:hypothetical protein n=1 Tax=Streptosporangium sp. CA-135522 TaxID=3240072 RepID=UPI003D8B49BF
MERQSILRRAVPSAFWAVIDSPASWAIIDEGVPHRTIGGPDIMGPDIMKEQPDHPLEIGLNPWTPLEIGENP